jgi:hypothetical protein
MLKAKKIIIKMAIHIDIETDALYLLGYEVGLKRGFNEVMEKERTSWILNCWRTGMKPSMISSCLNLPIERVELAIANAHEKKDDS